MAVYIAYNNYCWHHKTFGGRTPAMAAGVTGHRWTMAELFDRVMQSVE